MSAQTNIEWTDATWNPVSGCTEVSPGCDHCYAKSVAERFRGTQGHYYENGFDVALRPDKLDLPLRWTKPKRIFVNSMSDLFHDQVPDEYIARVFAVMALAPQHTFQLLTKRHGRMRSLLSQSPGGPADSFVQRVKHWMWIIAGDHPAAMTGWHHRLDQKHEWWPLENVWLGVSVENQQWADIRIPALLETPAAVRFLSMEPLLGPVDLSTLGLCNTPWNYTEYGVECICRTGAIVDDQDRCTRSVDWVIVGGESGRGARPMHPNWARSLRDQCVDAGVPFLFKQWGEWVPEDQSPEDTVVPATYRVDAATATMRLGKKAAGRELDGRTWDEYPGGES